MQKGHKPGTIERMAMDKNRIQALVVDDEPNLAELLSAALRYEGWDVITSNDGKEAVELAEKNRPDIIVLDVMLPELSGFEVLHRIRSFDSKVPILFLTAKDQVEDRVHGINVGADDYVTKPFSLEELVARLRGLLRRAGVLEQVAGSVLEIEDLILDEDTHEVTRGGEEINLTRTEFEMLRFLMRNPKHVLSKAQILDQVWPYNFNGESSVVELYISYLRKKIDKGRAPLIRTVRGIGYIIKPSKK